MSEAKKRKLENEGKEEKRITRTFKIEEDLSDKFIFQMGNLADVKELMPVFRTWALHGLHNEPLLCKRDPTFYTVAHMQEYIFFDKHFLKITEKVCYGQEGWLQFDTDGELCYNQPDLITADELFDAIISGKRELLGTPKDVFKLPSFVDLVKGFLMDNHGIKIFEVLESKWKEMEEKMNKACSLRFKLVVRDTFYQASERPLVSFCVYPETEKSCLSRNVRSLLLNDNLDNDKCMDIVCRVETIFEERLGRNNKLDTDDLGIDPEKKEDVEYCKAFLFCMMRLLKEVHYSFVLNLCFLKEWTWPVLYPVVPLEYFAYVMMTADYDSVPGECQFDQLEEISQYKKTQEKLKGLLYNLPCL